MNAPWKPNAPGNRDVFNAFICDDAALDVLRPVVIEMGWQPEKCHKGGLRNAVQSLSISASPNILLVDLSESGDPLSDINALAEVCEPGTVVIAVGQVNDVRLYRDLLASGIHDYLLKPLSPGQVRDALVNAQAVFAAPKAHDPSAVKKHISTAVIGTRGGVGASTLATSLAWLFSADEKMPTALLDLDVHFGTGALALDLEPGRGLTDAIENPGRIDGLFIERAMIRANDHLAILSAEAPMNTPLMTDGAAFVQLEEEFRQAFEMTVVDLPRNMLINFPHLLGDVNVALVVVEMTLASARDAIRILSWLKANAPQVEAIVIANKIQTGTQEISKVDFEASIERKIAFSIPYDIKAATTAAKLGQTFADAKGPDIYIANLVSKRTDAIRKGLPDALDLLVICAEAGLTVDASFNRVARELGRAYPELGDEFALTAIELSFLGERRQAFENLAWRVNLEAVKGVTTTMVQTERYGTPLASALRVLSAEFRNERMMRAEEKAARLPAIMTVPLILFILPVLFIVILGPAACSIADAFSHKPGQE